MKLKKYLSLLMVLALALSALTMAVPVSAETTAENYTVTKISNPDRGQREVDGLIAGGDRENSYAWRLAERGDYIYIATTRNLASSIINSAAASFETAGMSKDTLWALIDVITNGDIPRSDEHEGADIISYNRKTGEFKVIYAAPKGDFFRMVVTFGDNVYFGSYNADPSKSQYILKLDTNGKFTKVYQTKGSVSLRANCVYDDHLYFAGADDREVIPEGADRTPVKMAVLQKSNENDKEWNRVADYRDFGETPYDPIMSNWAGSLFWELATHNGYIYATSPSTAGFVIYRGHPAEKGETANEYGWYWEEVAGPTNGINNPGLSEVEGGEPGTMRSLIGSVYEFNGDLYAYNFDHAFGGEAQAFAGAIQMLGDSNVKASDILSYMYDSLHNPQKLWKLDDETGEFEECTKFTRLTRNTTNEYVWRTGEHDGQMYIATMDANVFYNYLTQLTSEDFTEMTDEELQQRITYLKNFILCITKARLNEYFRTGELKEDLYDGIDMLKTLLTMEVDRENIKQFISNYKDALAELSDAIESVQATLDEKDFLELAEYVLTEDVMDKILDETLKIDGILFKDVDVAKLIPADLTDEKTQEIVDAISIIAAMGVGYNDLDEESQASFRELIANILKAYLSNALEDLKGEIGEIYDDIDWDGLDMYMYISNTVKNNQGGFDLFRTKDGVNFEVVTRDGFGDKYNYGCSAFLATEEGLYIGTCNPFYGAQLYLLQTGIEPQPKTSVYFVKSYAYTYVKKTVQIRAYVKNPVGKTTYKSLNPTIAKVNSKGVVTALKKGVAKIEVTNNGKKNVYTVHVKNPVLNYQKKTLKVKKSFTLKVKKGLVGKATFKSSKKSVATVTKSGKVVAKKAGKATITVTANGVKLKCKITVKK